MLAYGVARLLGKLSLGARASIIIVAFARTPNCLIPVPSMKFNFVNFVRYRSTPTEVSRASASTSWCREEEPDKAAWASVYKL